MSAKPRVRRQFLGNFTHLLVGENDNVEELDYGCGPNSAPIAMTSRCKQMKIIKNVNHKKMMIKVRELKMFNMMGMRYLNLWMRKKIMLILFHLS